MSFSEKAKLTALAIVHVFETSKPFGDYAACVVLNDGAGISYGINQFTHRSGSLAAVVERFLAKTQSRFPILEAYLPQLTNTSQRVVDAVAKSEELKRELRLAARRPEMRAAQREIAFEKYLNPAIQACEGSGFTLPLSLAVVYDSINHGSWERIRDSVTAGSGEKRWITDYATARHKWLSNIPRLKSTSYRTRFFLEQIAAGNWNLDLPLNVRGVRLDDAILKQNSAVGQPTVSQPELPQEPPSVSAIPSDNEAQPPTATTPSAEAAATPPPAGGEFSGWETTKQLAGTAAEYFDKAEPAMNTLARRRDSAKSVWAAVGQGFWAVLATILGVPWQVWLVIALVLVALGIFYYLRHRKNAANQQ